jgi:hypothetical protein
VPAAVTFRAVVGGMPPEIRCWSMGDPKKK